MNRFKASCVLAALVASMAIASAQQEPPMPEKGGSHRAATKSPSRKVVPPPKAKTIGLVGVRFEEVGLKAGGHATLRLQLNAPAPQGGVMVMLKAQGPAKLALPKRITIAEGTNAYQLTVRLPKGAAGDYTIQATSKLSNGKSIEKSATLKAAR